MREGSLSFGTRSAHSLCRAQRVSPWLPLAGGGVPGVVRDLAGECWDGERDRGWEDVVELFGELEHLLFATPGCPFALREDRVPSRTSRVEPTAQIDGQQRLAGRFGVRCR